ncbi:hypothetical protein GWI33_018301 [Rhynchophorus ferrugineus]|uniref:Uncharacterized protein n=1 Tax=Rhynchophorus ferrugineus TaxID=354439 RepID=A0A834HY61_RHYFE|nr:hypothetical protein GWI33_018301 [Rhynchophorus ferrugineus]
MTNSSLSIFLAKEESYGDLRKRLQEQTEECFKKIEKRKEGFTKALEAFVLRNTIDSEYLSISKELVEALGKHNGHGSTTGGTKKKTNNKNILEPVLIKREKVSEGYQSTVTSSSVDSAMSISEVKENIKMEKDDMPAPTYIPPKRKLKGTTEGTTTRVTRTKGKKVLETKNSRDSDVVLEQPAVPVIHLSDSDDSDSGKTQVRETSTRSTRTKTRNNKVNGVVEDKSDVESLKDSQEQSNGQESSVIKETRSTRTKTIRKGKKIEEEEIPTETRSTRTKTLRKDIKKENVETNNVDNCTEGSTASEEPAKQIEETEQPPTKSTRTKTIKKAVDQDAVDGTNTTVAEATRSTRTKTRKAAAEANNVPESTTSTTDGHSKRPRSRSMESDPVEKAPKKKSKSPPRDTNADADTTSKTEYEDAESSLGPAKGPLLNATYVTGDQKVPASDLPPQNVNANATIIVEKPKFNIFNKEATAASFLTDDDSRELKATPKKVPAKSSKEVFSPYEKTTLKKKVEAFEKLQTVTDMPVKANATLKTSTTPSVKEKAKLFTPLGSKFMPSGSSTSKLSRLISHQQTINNDSLLAMKSAQKDSRDRQRRLLEREQALKKKEAMLLAQAEAKRKLNEEKQLKAQQQRKVLEAEKQKQLELQKQKEERLRQRELEREEYLMKQKLEAEKKRLAQKKKMQEMQAQREKIVAEQNRNPPTYMTTRPPRLPTEDCYDSDDPCYRTVKPPTWCLDEYSRIAQLAMLTAGDKIKNTLFCRHAQTPDLKEIFEVIDPNKLKRSSSILWRKPPRYTMMADLNDTKFSEDDEIYESD